MEISRAQNASIAYEYGCEPLSLIIEPSRWRGFGSHLRSVGMSMNVEHHRATPPSHLSEVIMNKNVDFRVDTRAGSLGHKCVLPLAFFGGNPVVPKGSVTPWPAPKKKHLDALGTVVGSGKYHRVNHPVVSGVEQSLGKWTGNWTVRAVGSGTAAVHVALDYFKTRGSRVITGALNWPGAVGPISISGLQPEFVDVDLNLAGLDQHAAADHLGNSEAAVLITHLFGNNILVPELRKAARSQGVAIIDDICQSIAASKNIADGEYLDSDALALSGNGAKHLGAGELGFVLSNNTDLIDHVDNVSLTSSSRNGARVFSPNSQGYNYRPNVFSAAVAASRIDGLDKQLDKRRTNAIVLWHLIGDLPGLLPLFNPYDRHQSLLNFPVRIDPEALGLPPGPQSRDFMVQLLQAEGVPVRVWLTKPVFEFLPEVRSKWNSADFPNTVKLLDTMFYVSEIAPPNNPDVMKLFADAFHKVWEALPFVAGRMSEVTAEA